jgi:hypothetical protein
MQYDTIVISGGGIKGFGMLGILYKLTIENNLDTKSIKNFVGSSIGGIISAMLCFDFLPIEIFFFFFDLLPIESHNIDRIRVVEKLKAIFKDTKFKEIDKTLVLTSYNKHTRESLFYSKLSHPDKKIIDALYETGNIPFLMSSDEIYIDGCLCSPFPVKYSKDHFFGPLLGIYTFAMNVNLLPISNPYDDLKIILHQFYNTIISYEILFSSKDDTIIKLDSQIPFEIFKVDFELATKLFLRGYAQNL